jgi:hypothetical protein
LTSYSFLFKDMLKCLLLRERTLVVWTLHPKERETIAIKPYFGPASQDHGEQIPTSLIQQMMPSTTIGLDVSNNVRN